MIFKLKKARSITRVTCKTSIWWYILMLILSNLSFQVLICRTCRTLFCHITFNKLELPYLIIEYKDRKSCQVSILPNSFGGIYLVLARAAFREGCFSWWTEFWIWWSGMWLDSIFWIDNCLLFFLILQAGGILQILQSDSFWEWAVFYDLAR